MKNKILVINPGSITVKYSLYNGDNLLNYSVFKIVGKGYRFNDVKIKKREYANSLNFLLEYYLGKGLIGGVSDIKKVGVRIVHGGKYFSKPTILNASVIKKLEKLSELAPLHNPPALRIISEVRNIMSKARVWGVFDTSFHSGIPEYASIYAIPSDLTKKLDIKRYGFHGIACKSAIRQVKKKYKKLPENIIVCHLGGGSSITAIKKGKSIDTSMGFTPLEGLMMTTRSGDIDPGIISYISKNRKVSLLKVMKILNNDSGFVGMTGIVDIEKIVENAVKGDKKCKLALDIYTYKLYKYICSYIGILKGTPLIVFSGGVGEGSFVIRKIILKELKWFGITSKDIMIVKCDEALEIKNEIE